MRRAATVLAGVLVCSAGLAGGTAWGHAGKDHGGSASTPDGPTSVTQGDFYPMGEEGEAIFGSAKLLRYSKSTALKVHVRGLTPETKYPMHLHAGSCPEMGPHYRDDPSGPGEPPNELWPSSDPEDPKAGVRSNGDGVANGEGRAPWVARPEAAAVMIHNERTGKMVACADLS